MRTVQQTVDVPGASAGELFGVFADAREHGQLTAAAAVVEAGADGSFALFDGAVRGTTLVWEPGRLLVQRWRGGVWRDDDPDSIVVLRFEDGRVELVHALLPDQFVERWHELYWAPLRARFSS